MAFDKILLGEKLARYRDQFQFSLEDVSSATGISQELLFAFENGDLEPSGDQILILADFYKCDYKFFVSNEKLAPFEQTEALFRRFGNDLVKEDRIAIQEFLYLADCESFLEGELGSYGADAFSFQVRKKPYKTQASEAAQALRRHFGVTSNEIRLDLYKDLRSIGIHVFRRKLNNSNISGLFLRHPAAGKCILVNFSEDIYRQRFTAAHEAGHALLDDGEDFVVSLKADRSSFQEKRANAFAAKYLMPLEFLSSIPEPNLWSSEKAVVWASKLKVSTEALAYALKDNGFIDQHTVETLKSARVPKSEKEDPELPQSLSPQARMRKAELLSRGLSSYYVGLCFRAYRENVISAARLTEILLLDSERDLHDLAQLFGEGIRYDN